MRLQINWFAAIIGSLEVLIFTNVRHLKHEVFQGGVFSPLLSWDFGGLRRHEIKILVERSRGKRVWAVR